MPSNKKSTNNLTTEHLKKIHRAFSKLTPRTISTYLSDNSRELRRRRPNSRGAGKGGSRPPLAFRKFLSKLGLRVLDLN